MIFRYSPWQIIAVGLGLVLAGVILPMLMMFHVLKSTFFLNFLSYGVSIGGVFMGILGAAMYVAKQTRD